MCTPPGTPPNGWLSPPGCPACVPAPQGFNCVCVILGLGGRRGAATAAAATEAAEAAEKKAEEAARWAENPLAASFGPEPVVRLCCSQGCSQGATIMHAGIPMAKSAGDVYKMIPAPIDARCTRPSTEWSHRTG